MKLAMIQAQRCGGLFALVSGLLLLQAQPEAAPSILVLADLPGAQNEVALQRREDARPVGSRYRIVVTPSDRGPLEVWQYAEQGERNRLFHADQVDVRRSLSLPSETEW